MTGVVARVLVACVIAVSPSVTVAQRTASAVPLLDVAPPAIDTTTTFLDRRIPAGSRLGAIAASSLIGLGVGHRAMGFTKVADTFLLTQGAGFGLMLLGFGIGGGEGSVAFFGGMGLYIGSRVWEFADVVIRPTAHNARIDAAGEASNRQRAPQARLSPVLTSGRQGLTMSISF